MEERGETTEGTEKEEQKQGEERSRDGEERREEKMSHCFPSGSQSQPAQSTLDD